MQTFFTFFSSRYRAIVFSIALFIIFDLSILLMNFYISNELSKDAGVVNLAAQMRMMSQRMVKSLYEIDQAIEEGGNTQNPLAELKQGYQSFDEALVLFQQGGSSSNLKGEKIDFEMPRDQEAQETIKHIAQLWSPYKNILSPLVGIARIDENNPHVTSALKDAISYGSANNVNLLKLSTQLGERIETLTAEKVSRLKLVQITGMSFALLNFIVILFHFIGRLRKNDNALEESRQQTRQILNTVQEGLLLIDRDGIIGSQYSAFIENIFPDSNISGESIFDLLRSRVTDSDLQVAQKYIRLLFKEAVKDNLTADLNPLKRVELHKFLENGRSEKTILSFNFSQVAGLDGSVHSLLVTLKNISEVIELEDELKKTRSETDDQLQIIKNILRSDAAQYENYLKRALDSLNHINHILETATRDEENNRKKIDAIFIDIHRLKGDSSVHNMSEIASHCHQMESELKILREAPTLKGDDFMVLTIKLKELLQKIETYKLVTKQLTAFGKHKGNGANKICSAEQLLELAESIANGAGKKVELIYSEIGTDSLPDKTKALVADLIIQLLRNAVVHGIETAEERKKRGKHEQGKIVINILHKQEQLTISVRDDGSGIDFARLKQKAMENSAWKNNDIENWKGKDLIKILFLSGLSTSENISTHAGRGVGMNLVKDCINKLDGKIAVATTPNRATSFQIKIPTSTDTGKKQNPEKTDFKKNDPKQNEKDGFRINTSSASGYTTQQERIC